MTTQREIEVEGEVVIVRIVAGGNLHLRGGGDNRVRVESNEAPAMTNEGGVVEVQCDDNCVVDVPSHAQVEVNTRGNLTAENLAGSLGIARADGNASLSDVGEVHIQQVRGDLRVAQAAGINAEDVRGNAHINDVAGAVSVNTKGDAHLHRAKGSASVNCKGNAHLSEISGKRVQVNAKGDTHLVRCRGEIAVNAAGNVHLHEIVSQRVRAVAKGDIRVHFSEATGGQAKIVTSGDLLVRNGEKTLRKGKGIYTFRFGEGDAVLALVSKGDTLLEGVDVAEGNLRGISEDMGDLGAEIGAELGAEMGAMGAQFGAMGAEMGRDFGNLGRDIARQVQDKVARKMKEMGKRTGKMEWGEGKSWSFNFDDMAAPPKAPTPPTPPHWNAPFDAVEEVATGEPVSDEERGLVLRMLEEGKISATEAATLLEALGDGG
jgi:Tfp pilus assembly protein FimT